MYNKLISDLDLNAGLRRGGLLLKGLAVVEI